MKEKLSTFQIILLVATIFLIVISVFVFSLRRVSNNGALGTIDLWGTVPRGTIDLYLRKINELQKDSVNINYKEFSENTFQSELIEALASGEGPDAVIFSDDMLVKHGDKIFTIPYDSYPQSSYRSTFIEAGDVLLKSDGIVGLPFLVDPLVMYWNRTTLNSAGISNPPQYWDEFVGLVERLTRKDTSANISKATIALGEFRNIKNAQDILTTLILQAGNPIIVRDQNDNFKSNFNERLNYSVAPADAGIAFFTQFSDPSKQIYTWNRTLPNSDEMFLVGDLAFYIGFAGERIDFIKRNPNLNFGVSQIPQSRSSVENNKKNTGAKLYFLSILNASDQISDSLMNIYALTSQQNMSLLKEIVDSPPVRRDLLAGVPSVDYKDTFYKSALIAYPFLEPDSVETKQVLSNAIESVSSGRLNISEAINQINNYLNLSIKK